MKNFILIATLLSALASAAAPDPATLPVGIEIFEENGVTVVREVANKLSERGELCTNCVHVGSSCQIGEGNCYSSEHASCTYCGQPCGSICVRDGIPCDAYC
ncbi:hypothetical protein B0H66DRAFT_559901 [Apodospora peruviana]|uniref:Uncharacterized protein n=1 Tax=Apodospora peruviana TaxID=516989 RepID=A0AAE0HZN4_9PEZI|nr:hypothetical protein B0H66DRAFT_559901 [Apodospora peruviana]